MDVANASMYDIHRVCRGGDYGVPRCRHKSCLSGGVHPHYVAQPNYYAKPKASSVHLPPAIDAETDLIAYADDTAACLIGQSPNVFGTITDLSPMAFFMPARR